MFFVAAHIHGIELCCAGCECTSVVESSLSCIRRDLSTAMKSERLSRDWRWSHPAARSLICAADNLSQIGWCMLMWLGSQVVSAGLRRRRARVQIAVTTLSGKPKTHRASVHQAAKLVAALLTVARVTAGLAESNGSLHRVYDSCHLHADCQEPGSASEPYARN